MNFLITTAKLIVLFVLGAWFIAATSKCHKQSNHGAFGIGVMFSAVTLITMFKVIMEI